MGSLIWSISEKLREILPEGVIIANYSHEPIYFTMEKHKKNSIKIIVLTILSFGLSLKLYAQTQPDIPKPRGPVDLSDTTNAVIFIVIPILIFIFYLIWRREMKKRKEREE
jgi:hypothetical protein